MRKVLLGMALALPLVFGSLSALSARSSQAWDWGDGVQAPFVPIDNPMSAAKVELGRRLFYDADLSINGTMSCASCHEQHHAFADGNRTHSGALDDPGRRNVPALVNLAWLSPLTWADPRQTTLEQQVAVPVFGEHPVEMAMAGHEAEIARRLERDPCYKKMFARAFPQDSHAVSYANVARALAAFERTLISRNSPWDRFRRGEADGFSSEARLGQALFQSRCASCHAGDDLTDAGFHQIAAVGTDTGAGKFADRGLAEVTALPADAGKFRTPGLRNVRVTAPYLHDGSAPTLSAAIRAHRDFASLDDGDVGLLAAFLDTTTDRDFLNDKRLSLPRTACGKDL